MAEETDNLDEEKVGISLYEFYALGIERLLVKAPWELEQAVSAYRESFLTEQRCLALTILVLLGEEHVPQEAAESMPGFEEQIRASVNQATFKRALKHYFEEAKLNPVRADMVLERMQSYLKASREADEQGTNPLEAMLDTMCRRVPPNSEEQQEQYQTRVQKIYDYVDGLVEGSLFKRYNITS